MSEEKEREFNFGCPLPLGSHPHVLMAHGGGGKLMADLIEQLFLPAFENEYLEERHDGAVVECGGRRIAFSTDSYVVNPLFFPGGDIGSLAVFGTVNDLAMCGARPLYLSCGLILEEGLAMETLSRIVRSMREAACEAGVRLVTGDTKVVDRGKGDGLFVNTAGIGLVESTTPVAPGSIRPGDAVLVSGDIGRAFVPPDQVEAALRIMKSHPHGGGANRIGEVGRSESGIVTARSPLGTRRIIDRLSGEQLPRIC